jgi:hypothetical protein
VEGSSPSQDKSVDFLQKYTKLVVIHARLLHQVLLGKVQYLQAGPDYRHGGGAEDAGNVYQSTLGRHLLLRLCSRCLLCSNGSRRSALLRSYSHHLFDGGGCGFCALLTSRGWRSKRAMSSTTVGAGLRLPAGSPTVSHSPSSPSSTGSVGGTSYIQGRLLISK